MIGYAVGFEPVYNENSKILILGSFPSVKSRKNNFYYGNKQNRFWNTLYKFFNEDVADNIESKTKFILKHHLALWDVVQACEIDGSKDSSIKNYVLADMQNLLQKCKIEYIILNGGTAYTLFDKNFAHLGIPYVKLTSTSPANTRYTFEEWSDGLQTAYSRIER